MSSLKDGSQNEVAWTRVKLEEVLEKGQKDMQDLAVEGSIHLREYFVHLGCTLAALYLGSRSDHCYIWRLLLFSLVPVLAGVPFLLKAYTYAEVKNRCDRARLKYAFQQDPELTDLFEEDYLGKMYNYAIWLGTCLLLILASTAIFINLVHYFLCARKHDVSWIFQSLH